MPQDTNLSPSMKLKQELCHTSLSDKEKIGFLAGFVRSCGIFSFTANKQTCLTIKTNNSSAARLCYQTLKNIFDGDIQIFYETQTKFEKKTLNIIKTTGNCIKLVKELEYMDDMLSIVSPNKMLSLEYQKGFYIGLFCSSGSYGNPAKNYYFDFYVNNEEVANAIRDSLNNLYTQNEDINKYNFKVIKHYERYRIYIKRSEMISNFILYLGATSTMMDHENIRITKDYFNNDNRYQNCLTENMKRQVANAQENIKTINKVIDKYGLDFFDDTTKAVIKYRLDNEDASYKEIADELFEQGYNINKNKVFTIFKKLKSLI